MEGRDTSRADRVEELARIAKAVGDADVECQIAHLERRLPASVKATELGEVHVCEGLSGGPFHGAPYGGFDDASRCAEDDRRTGGFTQRFVEILVGKSLEIDVRPLDQVRQLSGGDGHVHVGDAAGGEFLPGTFVFLRQTGHDGDDHQFLLGNADFLG